MGPKTVVDIRTPAVKPGEIVEYRFKFDEWHCGWDAMQMLEFQGLTFPENQLFAWCGPLLGLAPSNSQVDRDTLIALPSLADKVVLFGHTANDHYNFEGTGMPIEALDREGVMVAAGKLPAWSARDHRALTLSAPGIARIRIPSSKPVFFLKRMRVHFARTGNSE